MTHQDIPEHLQESYELVLSSFPNGIPKKQYLPLLRVLYDHHSDRNLAEVIAKVTGRSRATVLNDIWEAASLDSLSEPIQEVLHLLTANGLSDLGA